ncbi:MAG: type II toxin-antitoxin system RelE/ParE family toxin, partial [Rhodanobacter sp.]
FRCRHGACGTAGHARQVEGSEGRPVTYRLRYTSAARDDLLRLCGFMLERDKRTAKRAPEAIRKGVDVVRTFPFTCRKADPANPFLRVLLVSFGPAGYVALYEIEDNETVTNSPCGSSAGLIFTDCTWIAGN